MTLRDQGKTDDVAGWMRLNQSQAARIAQLETALQLIGNELSLHADKGPAGEAFRALLNPTFAQETPAPSKGKPMFNYNGDLVGYEPETSPVFTLEQRDWIRNNYEALIAAGWRNPSVSETKGEPK